MTELTEGPVGVQMEDASLVFENVYTHVHADNGELVVEAHCGWKPRMLRHPDGTIALEISMGDQHGPLVCAYVEGPEKLKELADFIERSVRYLWAN